MNRVDKQSVFVALFMAVGFIVTLWLAGLGV